MKKICFHCTARVALAAVTRRPRSLRRGHEQRRRHAADQQTECQGAEVYRLNWDRYIARSIWPHGMVSVYWDAGAAGENHSSGLFDREPGAQAYPEIIQALAVAAK